MLNGHRDLSHMAAIKKAVDSLLASGMDVVSVGFVSDPKLTAECFRQGMEGISRSTHPDLEGHAGEWEISLALRPFPELVDREAAQLCQPNLNYNVEAFRAETLNTKFSLEGLVIWISISCNG
jgi:hypothetical protein